MSARSGSPDAPGGDASTDVAAALSRWLTPVVERSGQDCRVDGSVTLRHFGYVRLITCVSGPLRVTRTPRPAAPETDGSVALLAPSNATVRLAQDGRGTRVENGQLALVDLRRPFSVEQQQVEQLQVGQRQVGQQQVEQDQPARKGQRERQDRGVRGVAPRGPGRMLFFRVPVHALHVPAATLRSVTARAVTPSGGAGTVLAPLLRHLDESAPRIPAAVGERFGGIVTDLMAALAEELAEDADGPPETGRRRQIVTIRQYIDRHLGDPDLSAERIARAHLISVRYLHRLFEGEGITVGRLIQRLRVEGCARELSRRGRVGPSLSVVAARWGFRSTAHFSRAFKAVHGCAPQQWRRLTVAADDPAVRSDVGVLGRLS
ncbi:helix-turn-helix domain-containing protein [Streptomyces sp. NPDC050287]|uniref:helix-turn-helix domain-containing protein n=1 Tax=Streptomyces sp. NPDC050287 TaxID=3365608 RepID=UPI0037A99811